MLAKLRKDSNLSQEKLGFDAEMDRSFISLLERGKRSPTLDTMVRLACVFGLTLTQLAEMVEEKIERSNG
ncbi:helix-turn-helix transcriptional regulator [Pseudomonas sp. AB12(2023)]|uniref:helix-turn-helix domain-containing protein n=1 Tax=Pseudomonas sp. AB12(2023) TaxID=3048597 RepID=UPI002B224962|nr:helix-turn-helix transcriptional regulator [Pseudomonas sp. AB12(2023)]MEB0222044.1 helix-turn-helix transcriptional regulator [Pseudomonas sp. AB12(2023)]